MEQRSVPEHRLRVGIDAHMVGGHETGNETYVKGLVAGLDACDEDIDVIVFHAGAPWLAPGPRVRFERLLASNPYTRLGAELPARSLAERLDILHMTYGTPIWSAAPLVVTIHDICYATNPEWFSPRDLRVLRAMVPRSIKQAAHVITDSQDARRQIIDHYAVPPSKISAIPIGPGAGAQPITTEEASEELRGLGLDPERPYVLTVGNIQPRKNLVRLVEAFNALVHARGHDLDLVIVGPKHFRAEDIVAAAAPVADRVHFTGYVTDRQLAACYRLSAVYVFPSLYEGFGLPAIEAMAHGTPIACSDAGSLPEVCGDAAVLFDPLSVESMIDAVDRILVDGALRKRLIGAAAARVGQFDWKRTAKETLAVYRSVSR
jgi:glycosyltransferase involved in cell wall biosynthesis